MKIRWAFVFLLGVVGLGSIQGQAADQPLQEKVWCEFEKDYAGKWKNYLEYVCGGFFARHENKMAEELIQKLEAISREPGLTVNPVMKVRSIGYQSGLEHFYGEMFFLEPNGDRRKATWVGAPFALQDQGIYFQIRSYEIVNCEQARLKLQELKDSGSSDYESLWRAEQLIAEVCTN